MLPNTQDPSWRQLHFAKQCQCSRILESLLTTTSPTDAKSQRPYNTTLPLANSLGLNIDSPCDYDDTQCAANAALQYTGGNVLIAWEHKQLRHVAEALGADDVPKYPGM